jgi:hypothetical protein
LRAKADADTARAKGHIPDSDVANFAYRMLQACHRRGMPPPVELVELFKVHSSRTGRQADRPLVSLGVLPTPPSMLAWRSDL